MTNDLTRQIREFKTEASGAFLLPSFVPGDYNLGVTKVGFKTYTQQIEDIPSLGRHLSA